jgi:hypothetical protein
MAISKADPAPARRARAPRFEIIKNNLYVIIISNLKKKHLLLLRIRHLPGLRPVDPHHGFAFDPLGALRQLFDPLATTAPSRFEIPRSATAAYPKEP